MTEEDFETTEGETVDLYDKLMEMTGWIVTAESQTRRTRMVKRCSQVRELITDF